MNSTASRTGNTLRPVTKDNAQAALQQLLQGFRRFRQKVYPQQQALFKRLASAQSPSAMFITCADSRIVPELITQSDPGTLFVTRNVGNVVPPYGQMNGGVSTAIEYAVLALGVQHIIVCGHSDCGAMKAVLNPASLDGMPTVRAWLRHAEVARSVVADRPRNPRRADRRERSGPARPPAHSPFRRRPSGQRPIADPWLGLRHRQWRHPRL